MSKKTPNKQHKSGRRSDSSVSSTSGSVNDTSGQFSPIPASPASRTPCSPAGGRLTGLPRKVKDTCADWHNCMQEWDALNSRGMLCASQIANQKIAGSENHPDENEGEAGNDLSCVLPDGLETLCKQLKSVYLSMAAIVKKFEVLTTSMRGVVALDKSQHDLSTHGLKQPLFQTWPTELFYETSQSLLEMYSRELALKGRLVENMAHAGDRDTLMAYTASWLHQPYVDPRSAGLLEGMLLETGLR